MCAQHILLTGGNCCFPNFAKRFTQELRPLLPDWLPSVHVYMPKDPILFGWKSAKQFAIDRVLPFMNTLGGNDVLLSDAPERYRMVSRAEYLEHGSYYCTEKFSKW